MVLAPLPLILAGLSVPALDPGSRILIPAVAAALASLLSGMAVSSHPGIGKIFGTLGLSGSFFVLLPVISTRPAAFLGCSVLVIGIGYALLDMQTRHARHARPDRFFSVRLQWSAGAALCLTCSVLAGGHGDRELFRNATAASIVIQHLLLIHWALKRPRGRFSALLMVWGLAGSTLMALSLKTGGTYPLATGLNLLILAFLPGHSQSGDIRQSWWETLLDHPARFLLFTFLGLCLMGTLMLSLPAASKHHGIPMVDAAFTSVSAVCVTGLTVLDTQGDFTFAGQALILLMIQLGGLGIMSITTVALHAAGLRLSLRQERLMTTMADTSHRDLIASLTTILTFTFAAETMGAVFLTGVFSASGEPLPRALWQGVFSSISAFCNAGFALNSNSLVPFSSNPWMLHGIAVLIIAGGMAPATCLAIPRWLSNRPTPTSARIALTVTVAMLVSGTVFFLAFEWNNTLDSLSIADRINNAWFQSVTLRTAGFNSIDISAVTSPTFLVMLFFMFIGGSPGGTAGGVKTTTLGILVATFWANITLQNDVIIHHRRVPSATIKRAVTIVVSGLLVWFSLVLMLEITQQIPMRDIIFETTSALGTVGLSTGVTASLDGIGKIIIILAMFAGRIGPMTLFMLLQQDNQSARSARYPDTKISLT